MISGDVVRNSTQTATEFVKALVEQKGFTQHFEKLANYKQKQDPSFKQTAQNMLEKLTKELEMKVIWARYVTDKERL